MYTTTLLASAAILAGSALASAPGKAVIVNACNYPVYLSAVPSADGGYQESDTVLAHGDSWNQTWTQLTNGNGWSLKLSKSSDRSHPLQYEYTYHSDESVVWFDLSCVDGNPWDGNWEVSSAGNTGCKPKQSFYRYATDDAFGMQDCPHDSDITVTLCSGEDQAESIVSSIASAVPTTAQAVATSAAAVVAATTPTVAAVQTPQVQHVDPPKVTGAMFDGSHYYAAGAGVKAVVDTPTTLATSTLTTPVATVNAVVANADGDIVTVIETVVETAIAYETYVPGKRHVHHPEHPHFR